MTEEPLWKLLLIAYGPILMMGLVPWAMLWLACQLGATCR